jgi:hypothetical protein
MTAKRPLRRTVLVTMTALVLVLLAGQAAAQETGSGTPQEIPCPTDLHAEPLEDGSVRLAWEAAEGVDGYVIMRWDGDANPPPAGTEFTFFETNETMFTDTTTEAHQTYTYEVSSTTEETFFHGEDCPTITVTTIPFFTGILTALVASLGAIGLYARLRRRD